MCYERSKEVLVILIGELIVKPTKVAHLRRQSFGESDAVTEQQSNLILASLLHHRNKLTIQAQRPAVKACFVALLSPLLMHHPRWFLPSRRRLRPHGRGPGRLCREYAT